MDNWKVLFPKWVFWLTWRPKVCSIPLAKKTLVLPGEAQTQLQRTFGGTIISKTTTKSKKLPNCKCSSVICGLLQLTFCLHLLVINFVSFRRKKGVPGSEAMDLVLRTKNKVNTGLQNAEKPSTIPVRSLPQFSSISCSSHSDQSQPLIWRVRCERGRIGLSRKPTALTPVTSSSLTHAVRLPRPLWGRAEISRRKGTALHVSSPHFMTEE